jgi:hypothetical protein
LVGVQEKQSSRPLSDNDAHNLAMSRPIGSVVAQLIDILGATTVAVIGGVTETRAVHQWTTGRGPHREHVLRFALQIALMIADGDGYESVRAWFQGSNPHLDDGIPALMLRSQPLEEIQAPLMRAARTFASRL